MIDFYCRIADEVAVVVGVGDEVGVGIEVGIGVGVVVGVGVIQFLFLGGQAFADTSCTGIASVLINIKIIITNKPVKPRIICLCFEFKICIAKTNIIISGQ